jgi:hypothetical protein
VHYEIEQPHDFFVTSGQFLTPRYCRRPSRIRRRRREKKPEAADAEAIEYTLIIVGRWLTGS